MVYPQKETKNVILRVINTLSSFFKITQDSSKEDALIIPDHESMQSAALHIYLEKYQEILVESKMSSKVNVKAVFQQMMHIFSALNVCRIYNIQKRPEIISCKKLSKVQYLINITVLPTG